MSHRHVACKPRPTSAAKCDHIDCECSTHLSESSEHVICKWDTSDQHMNQFSPLAGPRLESYSTASCIDTGGIKLTPMTPTESKMDSADASSTHRTGHVEVGIVQDSVGVKMTKASSREDDLAQLKSELAETQAVLQKTEEQLLQQIEQNQRSEEVGHLGTRPLSGYLDNATIASLQNVIGHLYLNKEDARKLLSTVKSRLQQMETNIASDEFLLRSQLLDLQVVLEDIIKGKGQSQGQSVTFDLEEPKEDTDSSRSINIVETLRQKLNDKESELHRWEVLVEQLHKELEQARLRCESNTNALYNKQEECRQREEALHNACLKAEKLERLVGALKSKVNTQGQTRTTQTDLPHATPRQSAEGALSQLTARLQQQQITASELQLEREHNQRLQELRLGVVEAGNRWEKEVMTLDLQVKQLTHQLEDARKTATRLEEEKNHQRKHLQEMRESLKQVMSSRDEMSAELANTRGEMARVNQQLAAAQTALTYERNTNEKLQEQCKSASQLEHQLNEQLSQLKEVEHKLSQQLADAHRGSSDLRKQCSALCSDLEQANEELQDRADKITRVQTEMEVAMTTAKAEMKAERDAAQSTRLELENSLQAEREHIEKLKEVVRQQDKELKVLEDTKKMLGLQKSENEHQEEMIKTLQGELKESQTAAQEQREENRAICKQREAVKRDLEIALVRQKSYKEWGILHEEKMEEALKRWEEEKVQLTNQITELQVTLKESECSLQQITASNQENLTARDRLQQRCESLQQHVHTKDVSLQTTLERLANAQRQLQEERRVKDAYERDLKMLRSSLEKKESSLHSQSSKVASLERMKAKLKTTTQTQKATITALQKQLKQHQKEFQNYKNQIEKSVNFEKEENDKKIAELEEKVDLMEKDLDHSKQKNAKLTADMVALSDSLAKKRTDHSELLLNLHKAEEREGELKIAKEQLIHQLKTERNTQESMKKRLEEEESEVAELRHSLARLQADQDSPEKTMLLDHLKDSLDSSIRLELDQLKAEISRQHAAVNQSPSRNKMSQHDKMLILQRELNKLRTIHTADRGTIATLTEDTMMLRNRLAKQKALILSSRTKRIRKSDIQAALAKAQAKALIMSPPKCQQLLTFDPGNHFYGIPRSAFDDGTLRGFSSDQVTPGSTAFSGGSSDCDYSS